MWEGARVFFSSPIRDSCSPLREKKKNQEKPLGTGLDILLFLGISWKHLKYSNDENPQKITSQVKNSKNDYKELNRKPTVHRKTLLKGELRDQKSSQCDKNANRPSKQPSMTFFAIFRKIQFQKAFTSWNILFKPVLDQNIYVKFSRPFFPFFCFQTGWVLIFFISGDQTSHNLNFYYINAFVTKNTTV